MYYFYEYVNKEKTFTLFESEFHLKTKLKNKWITESKNQKKLIGNEENNMYIEYINDY